MWSKCIITLRVAVSIYHVNNNTWIIFIVLIGVLGMVACIGACMLCSWVCLSAWFSAIRMVLHVFFEQKCRTEMKREYHQTPCSMLQTTHIHTRANLCKKFFISRHHYFSLEEWLLYLLFFATPIFPSCVLHLALFPQFNFALFMCIIFDLVCGACGIIEHPLNWFQLFAI